MCGIIYNNSELIKPKDRLSNNSVVRFRPNPFEVPDDDE